MEKLESLFNLKHSNFSIFQLSLPTTSKSGELMALIGWTDVNVFPVKPAGHWQWFGFMHTPSFKQGESQTGDEQSLPDQPLSQEHLKIDVKRMHSEDRESNYFVGSGKFLVNEF